MRRLAPLLLIAPALAFFFAAGNLCGGDFYLDAVEFGKSGHGLHEGPEVPEPLVFDLVRPLGAKKGELEINNLAIQPLTRRLTGSARAPDELGRSPLSTDRGLMEWAPEIEFALWDGFALEFELPFEGPELEALKFAAQWTMGTAFENRYIHGFQGIAEHFLESSSTGWTGVYIGAARFNEHWSMLGMWGFTQETGPGVGGIGGDRTQLIQNLNLFYDLSDSVVLGLETNYAVSLAGDSVLLVMPQIHYEMTPNWSVQFGVGAGFSASDTLPQAAIRVIWSN